MEAQPTPRTASTCALSAARRVCELSGKPLAAIARYILAGPLRSLLLILSAMIALSLLGALMAAILVVAALAVLLLSLYWMTQPAQALMISSYRALLRLSRGRGSPDQPSAAAGGWSAWGSRA